ncbi:MAG: GGDEF domain-containing protein [Candidatus Sedimenticola endophacoides]|uniref:diguanylate cyclase n=1 Tax=Candidatus Sedimenticola endophacoides TaxID=2548426 RepID=A0A6N4E8H1_9GAMM|nr:MAG: GGDEF domain-containing protein [Candidatus Sedimenticola endophacoides]PUE01820.1 MAG: GGDEF domain-containing protein [Candidatus Sedimenticola endophacoides]PUE05278.1 MAG: GGDEF domain-containing protein [Candidatus Sedimenticola endophacoides]
MSQNLSRGSDTLDLLRQAGIPAREEGVGPLFIAPQFQDLTAIDDQDEERVQCIFSGILNLGSYRHGARSLHGSVYRRGGEYLLVGEYDIAEYEALAARTLQLNTEMARREREVKRLNRRLRQSEQALLEASLTDHLTQLKNRRFFLQRAEQELAHCERTGQPLALALCDLDHFKQVNDTFGHEMGDRVLVGFAELAQGMIRKDDLLARYGGEEFVLMLPGVSVGQARHQLERIRARLDVTPVEGMGRAVTASFGVVGWVAGCAIDQLLRSADQGLYLAKERGRNCVVEMELDLRCSVEEANARGG